MKGIKTGINNNNSCCHIKGGINMLKGVIYARVSTEEQASEGYSIEGQKQLLYDYAMQRNIQIIDEYIDEG